MPPLQRRERVPLCQGPPGSLDWQYERGYSPGGDLLHPKAHAVRPASFPDHMNRRASLCGASVRVTGNLFVPMARDACEPCRTLALRYPRQPPMGRGGDVAHIEAAVGRADLMLDVVRRELERGTDRGRVTDVLLGTVDDVLTAIRPWHLMVGQPGD